MSYKQSAVRFSVLTANNYVSARIICSPASYRAGAYVSLIGGNKAERGAWAGKEWLEKQAIN
jgi:hypothetical protein